jgi:hypothetical protein
VTAALKKITGDLKSAKKRAREYPPTYPYQGWLATWQAA